MPTANAAQVAGLTWDAVRDRTGAMFVLPVGAACKEHGLHLPLNTDAIQAEWFAQKAAERLDALVWPTLTYGFYPAFAGYPGSISLSSDTFERLAEEVLAALLGLSPRGILVVNTGISTLPGMQRAIDAAAPRPPVLQFALYHGADFRKARTTLETQRYGSHADEIETSVMLAIAPDTVRLERAEASPAGATGLEPGPLEPMDKNAATFAPSGSWGDPTRATREKGEALVAAMLRDLDAACAHLTGQS